MKAYEWSLKFAAAMTGNGDIFQVLSDFQEHEVKALILKRAKGALAHTLASNIAGSVREISQKWRVIQNRVPSLKTTRVRDLVRESKLEHPYHQHAMLAAVEVQE